MKNKFIPLVLAASAVAASVHAAPLTQTTAVHTKPDATSPAITYLKAGTEPVASSAALANTPAGWMAVELPGPFQGYVDKNKDMTKSLDVKPGVSIRQTPDANGAVLAVAERGDKTVITGVHGRWAQVSLQRNLVGYIEVGGAPGYTPPIATAPAGGSTAAPIADAASTPPAPPPVVYSTGPGQPVAAANWNEGSSTLPRQFAGKFMTTRSILHPRRPYDWELVDNSGRRFAYLDVSKLLLTEQIDKYSGHIVVVFGAAKPTVDGRDIVIQVESLQLQLR